MLLKPARVVSIYKIIVDSSISSDNLSVADSDFIPIRFVEVVNVYGHYLAFSRLYTFASSVVSSKLRTFDGISVYISAGSVSISIVV